MVKKEFSRISITLNRRDFEYDVYTLVIAFYPGIETHVYDPAPAETVPADEKEETPELRVLVDIGDRIRIALTAPEREETEEEAAPPEEARSECKNLLKALLYRALVRLSGRTLPWGNLTGIRPVKLATALLEEGKSDGEAARAMEELYFTSPAKADLAVRIAQRERRLLSEMHPENGYSLYVGIPFCPSICLYCSFSSSPLSLWADRTDAYLDALLKEAAAMAGAFPGRELQTVYIGGGTPTTLSAEQLRRLLGALRQTFDFSAVREFTVEAGRPDSITEDKLLALREFGVSRISINPQTMNQETLDLIGRKHTVGETEKAFALARGLGFDNINMDLIVGLPGEGLAEVGKTMRRIEALGPDDVTVHALALKRAARLRMHMDEYEEISFKASDEIMACTEEACARLAMTPYYLYRQKNMAGNFENVGYARAGRAGLYNILIMEEVQSILALGASGSTKIVHGDGRIERIENVKDIRNYLERIDEMIGRKACLLEG